MTAPTPVLPPGDTAKQDDGSGQLKTVIDSIIRDAIDNQPRSLQRQIGPSEIGIPCERRVLHKLAGDKEPPRADVSWKPFIGTAVHAQLESIFDAANPSAANIDWVTERKLTVGHFPNGTPITGSADLFHIPSGTVVDWKIIGDKQLANYKANGPSEQYRVQAHTYGGGYLLDPEPFGPPKRVAIYFLPRDRRFEDGYLWSEPWNPKIWGDAINRINRLWREWDRLGMPAAAEAKEICEDPWCHWCRVIKRDAAGSERQNLFQDFPPF